MRKDSMSTKEDLEKQKQEQLDILKKATDAANALNAKKEKANKSKVEKDDSELADLKKMVLEQRDSLSEMKDNFSALTKERQKLEQEIIPVAEVREEIEQETPERKEEIKNTEVETKPENIEAEITVAETKPEIIENKNKPKNKAERRAENRKKNGIEEKPKKEETKEEQQKIDETREKVLANMEPKEEEKEEPNDLVLEDKKDNDEDTLEQKVFEIGINEKNINEISQKIKDKEYLEPEERALYEQHPDLFNSAVKKKWRSIGSWMAGGYLWLQKKLLVTPKTEKIIITDEEIAENHPANVADVEPEIDESTKTAEKEARKAEFDRRLHETLSITDMGAAYGIERAKIAANTPEIQEENKKPKKESSKEREARLTQKFIEKVQNQIDAKMVGEWAGASENERAEKARALYMSEKEVFDKEKVERAGIFTKSLHATENWWKNLENKKGGAFWKTAISSSMVGIGIIGGGIATGRLEASAGNIAWRLVSKVGLATALNSVLASNRMKTIISSLKPKDQEDIKYMKYVISGTGILASAAMGGGLVAGIAAGGYGVRKFLNYINEYKAKKLIKKKLENEKNLKSEDFKDGYDRNKMMENLALFDKEYSKISSKEKLNSLLKTALNYATSAGAGIATLYVMSPEIAHAENNNNHSDTKLEDNIQEQHAPTKSDSTNIDQKTAIDSSQIKPIDQNTTAPITTPEPKTPEIEFIKVDKGDGVTQTLKRLVDEDKAPKWVTEELGKNPKAEDYAKFAEKFGMLHPKDFEDSIKVAQGDSFGFDDKGNFMWKHGGDNFTVVKVDEHGHHEEGDWMDKMQDEGFKHSLKHDDGHVEEFQGGGPSPAGPEDVSGPSADKPINPNKIVEPEPIGSGGPSGESNPDNTIGPSNSPEVNIEPTNINPYGLSTEQLDYVSEVYKSYVNKIFPSDESLKYWSGIQNNSALDLIQVKVDVVATESRGLYRLAQTIFHQIGLEPKHPTLANPLEEKETIKNYIIRGMQYASSKNKLNQIIL